jgi:hypothetical protein
LSALQSKIIELAHVVAELRQHYALWWELANPEVRTKFKTQFDGNRDFFDPTARAHFQSVVVTTYMLLDSRDDVVSLRALMDELRTSHSGLIGHVEALLFPHRDVFARLASLRSKVFAHRDATYGPDTIFALASLSPEGIGACIDTLCAVMNDLYRAVVPGAEPLEFYDEADHRANTAREDCRRVLGAL